MAVQTTISQKPSLSSREAEIVVRAAELIDATFWGERHFWIEDRKRLEPPGEDIGPGLIMLAPHQKRIIKAALESKGGDFRWATIIYSAVKKSGKTRIAAMVAAWLAWRSGNYAEIYALANDGKQSADRVLAAIKKANTLGALGWRDLKTRIELPSGAFIEAVPVDPTGEAGGQPTGTFWSEMWGFRLNAKERLWTEMTIPPTRWGKAIRFVESYAGYVGESPVLEQLYDQGVTQAKRHPDFPDLPVYINERARIFCYWDTVPRMAWQTKEFYEAEAATLHPNEFKRVHRNEWVSSVSTAIPIGVWDSRAEHLPPLRRGDRTPLVLGLDASITGDCTALVVVSRHPGKKRHDDVAIRSYRIWKPPKGGELDYSETIEKAVIRWLEHFNVVQVAYDPYQLHKMCTDLRKKPGGWFKPFPQGKQRAIADKQFYDMVMDGSIAHDGSPDIREHVQNAASANIKGEKYMRFVKKSTTLPIDAVVAASMAAFEIRRLRL